MLTPFRWATAGLTAVGLAALTLVAVPAAALAARAPAVAQTTSTVGGPDLASRGVVVHLGPGATPLPAVDADTWLLADLTTGTVLAAKGAHTQVLPASTLKTLTAVTLMPKLDKQKVVTATWQEARAVGGHVGIVPGATYSVWDLWQGLLLPSANDAAAALADANGGMALTVSEMQQTARALGATDTVVKNDSGLDAPGQVSSAYDMALFARAALAIPDFRTVTMTFNYDFPGRPATGTAARKTYKIYTENRLLIHGYKGVVGGKTGFTSLAHRTFWGAAQRGGHTLVATLFQIHEPTEAASRKLLDWGFANLAKVTPVGTLVDPVAAQSPAAAAPGAAAVAGVGATAADGSTSGSGGGIPWVPVLLLVAVVAGVALLVLRRRRPAGPAYDAPLSRPARSAPHPVDLARPAEPPAPAPRPAAAVPTASAEPTPAPEPDPAPAAAAAGPPEPRPTEPDVPAAAAEQRGHVRVIRPPGRPPTA